MFGSFSFNNKFIRFAFFLMCILIELNLDKIRYYCGYCSGHGRINLKAFRLPNTAD